MFLWTWKKINELGKESSTFSSVGWFVVKWEYSMRFSSVHEVNSWKISNHHQSVDIPPFILMGFYVFGLVVCPFYMGNFVWISLPSFCLSLLLVIHLSRSLATRMWYWKNMSSWMIFLEFLVMVKLEVCMAL